MRDRQRAQGASGSEELALRWAEIAERSRRLVANFLEQQERDLASAAPMRIGAAFLEMTARLMSDPEKLVAAQTALWCDYVTLWQNTLKRLSGQETEPVVSPTPR
ncbi:MAG: hypothetical protein ACE5LL_09195 [Alphaproteobacteria bacterium]